MNSENLQTLLGQVRFSANLPPKSLEKLAAMARQVDVAAQAIIFREGEQHHDFHLLAEGHVALEMRVPGRDNVRLLTVGPGDVLAWSALLGDGQMTATATAIEPTRLVSLAAPALQAACASDHELGFAMMQALARALSSRLLATRLQLLDLFRS